MDFFCRKASYWTDNICTGWSGPNVPIYDPIGDGSIYPQLPTENPMEAMIYMHGFLKWDGCMEVYREETHYCDEDDVAEEFACLRQLRLIANEHMVQYEGGYEGE